MPQLHLTIRQAAKLTAPALPRLVEDEARCWEMPELRRYTNASYCVNGSCDAYQTKDESKAMILHGLPLWNWALQIVSLCTAYVGAELNSRRQREGFIVWLTSNVTLAILHAASGLWLLFLLDVMFFRVNIMGLRRWKSD